MLLLGASPFSLSVLIGAAALAVVAASPVLYTSAASSAFVQASAAARCEADLGASVVVRIPRPPPGTPASEAPDPMPVITEAAARAGGLGAPEVIQGTADLTAEVGGAVAPMGLLSRPGFEDHVDVVAGPQGTGVWVPDDLATRLALQPGDTIEVSRRRSADDAPRRTLRVAAVYRSVQQGPLDRYWCAARPALEARGAFNEEVPPPAVLADPSVLAEILPPLSTAVSFESIVVPPAEPVVTQDRLDNLATQTTAFRDDLTAAAGAAFDVSSTSAAPKMSERTAQVRRSLTNAIRPVALVGVLVVVTAMVALGPAWVRRRRHEVQLLRILGVSRSGIGAKAVLELAPLVLAGAAAGWLLARLAVATIGPSRDLDQGVVLTSIVIAGATATLALAGAGIAAAASAHRADEVIAARSSHIRALVVVALLAGASVAGLAALRAWRTLDESTEVNLRERQVGPSAVTVPAAVFLLAGLFSAVVWMLLTRRRRGNPTGRPHPVPLLAVRRLQAEPAIGAGLVAVGVASVATVLFGLVLSQAVRDGAKAKTRAAVGAQTAVRMVSPPSRPPDGTTVLLTNRGTPEGEANRVVLLGLDSATFADGASWYTGTGLGSLDRFLDDLRPAAPGRPVPVVLVSRPGVIVPADAGDLVVIDSRGRAHLPYQVVRRVSSFPGVGPATAALVMDQSALAPFDTTGYLAWSQQTDPTALIRELAAAGGRPTFAETAAGALDSSPLLYLGWALEFLTLLARVVGFVVLAGLAVHVSVRQRADALSGSFLGRMGLSRRRHVLSLALELTLLATLPLLVGLGVGWAMAGVMVDRYDTIPTAAPPLAVGGVAAVGVVIAALLALAVAVLALVADAAGRRLDVAEALRAPD